MASADFKRQIATHVPSPALGEHLAEPPALGDIDEAAETHALLDRLRTMHVSAPTATATTPVAAPVPTSVPSSSSSFLGEVAAQQKGVSDWLFNKGALPDDSDASVANKNAIDAWIASADAKDGGGGVRTKAPVALVGARVGKHTSSSSPAASKKNSLFEEALRREYEGNSVDARVAARVAATLPPATKLAGGLDFETPFEAAMRREVEKKTDIDAPSIGGSSTVDAQNLGWTFGGLWSSVFPTDLYPAEVGAGSVPAIASNAPLALRATNHTDLLEISGDEHVVSNTNMRVWEVEGESNILVYTSDAFDFHRSDFFTRAGRKVGRSVKFTFTDPRNHAEKNWSVKPNLALTRTLLNSSVWTTHPKDGLTLVLRFQAGDTSDPRLRDVILTWDDEGNNTALSSNVDAPALSASETAFVDQVVAGTVSDDPAHAPSAKLAAAARLTVASALSTLRVAHAQTDFTPLAASGTNAAAPAPRTAVLKDFAAVTSARALDADARGRLIAAAIQKKLAGASAARVQLSMHALSRAYAALHVADIGSTLADAHRRVNQFLAAPAALRHNARELNSVYFA